MIFHLQTVKGGSSSGKDYMLGLPGVSAPTGVPGESIFDPLNFCGSPTFTVDEAKRFREAELTHGRVAMLAALGWVVGEEWSPIFPTLNGVNSFVKFQRVEEIFPAFWEFILTAIAICEAYRIAVGWADPRGTSQIKDDYFPGDLGFDPLNLLSSKSEEEIFDLKTKELNNGRLAMIAVVAFAAQEDDEPGTTIWRELVERNWIPKDEANLLPY